MNISLKLRNEFQKGFKMGLFGKKSIPTNLYLVLELLLLIDDKKSFQKNINRSKKEIEHHKNIMLKGGLIINSPYDDNLIFLTSFGCDYIEYSQNQDVWNDIHIICRHHKDNLSLIEVVKKMKRMSLDILEGK